MSRRRTVLEFESERHGNLELGRTRTSDSLAAVPTGGIAVDGDGNVWVAAMGLEPAAAGGRGARGAAPAAAPADGAAVRLAAAPAARTFRQMAPELRLDAARVARLRPAACTRGGWCGSGWTRRAWRGTGGGRGGKRRPQRRGCARDEVPAQRAVPSADRHARSTGRRITTGLNRPAGFALDDAANEVYIADSGNHRIVVFDSNTGAYKRCGAARARSRRRPAPGPTIRARRSRQFRDPTCVKIAKDGMVYVCDRRATASRCSRRTAPS